MYNINIFIYFYYMIVINNILKNKYTIYIVNYYFNR